MENNNINLYNLFCENGYYPINQENIDTKRKIKCIDRDRYIVYPSFRNIRENKKPLRFHANNPDTISNIKHYIVINNINTEIISDRYIDAHSNLTFRCSCGRLFDASWGNFSSKDKHQCNECTIGKPTHAVPYNYVIDLIEKAGLKPLFSEAEYDNISSGSAIVENDYGYKSILTYQFIGQGNSPAWFHKSNPYTIDNINKFLSITSNGEYICISKQYNGKNSDLEILHNVCGKIFNATWTNLSRHSSENESNRHGTQCPYCKGLRTQSLHAVVLKQLFLELREGTIVEDKSCRNPITNCIMPTDIVNHKEKIVIEIQSWFHDFPDRQINDKIKKDYWESIGYTIYTPDIRDYTVLGMAQLFFPELTEIPSWVKYDFESKLDIDVVQQLLNSGLTVTEIAEKMGKTPSAIYSAIHDNRLRYPDNYKNKNLVQKKYMSQQATVQTAG